MSDFNRIGNPALAGGIARLFGVDVPSLPVVGSEVQVVTSPWERPEFWALMGGGLGFGYGEVTGAAGNQGAIELFNPIGSGVLCICEQIVICNDDAAVRSFELAWRNQDLPTSTGGWVNRDLRRATTAGGSGGLACRVMTATATPAAAAIIMRITMPASTTQVFSLDAVIPPSWGLMLRHRSNALGVVCCFIGRERAAPPPEIGAL